MNIPESPPMINPAILAAGSHAPLVSAARDCGGSGPDALHRLAWIIIGMLLFFGWALFPLTVRGLTRFTKENHLSTLRVAFWYIVPLAMALTWMLTR